MGTPWDVPFIKSIPESITARHYCDTIGDGGLRGQYRGADLVDRARIRLLSDVLEWIFTNRAMPATREQSSGVGLQFFRMHDDLRRILEGSLRASGFYH